MRITALSLFLSLFLVNCSNDVAPTKTADVANDTVKNEKDASTDTKLDTDERDLGPETDAGTTDVSNDVIADVADMADVTVDPQACTFPTTDANCPQGPFGPGTFLTSVAIAEDNTCCFDFTGDNVLDNEIGEILGLLGGFGINANQNIANAIQAGELVYLLEFLNWENEMNDPDFSINLYYGTDAVAPFDDNLLGMGDFLIDPISINQVTQKPKWGFQKASVTDGNLVASDGVLRLSFPGLLDAVRMEIVNANLTATVDPTADLSAGGRVALTNGELSGALLRTEFFASLNEAAALCACIGNPIFSPQGNGNYSCSLTNEQNASCSASPVQGCRFLGSRTNCTVLGNLGGRADVDTTGDNSPDAFSFGARVEGKGAKIVEP